MTVEKKLAAVNREYEALLAYCGGGVLLARLVREGHRAEHPREQPARERPVVRGPTNDARTTPYRPFLHQSKSFEARRTAPADHDMIVD